MDFQKRKEASLANMYTSTPDKSPKGDIDIPLIPLLETINSHPSFFTTSSCSGRISILSTPISTANTVIKKKAKGGNWVFITHDFADANSVQNAVFGTELTRLENQETGGSANESTGSEENEDMNNTHVPDEPNSVKNGVFKTESTRLENQENVGFGAESTGSENYENLDITQVPDETSSVKNVGFMTGSTRLEKQEDLVFRFEPLIIAIECKDVASAIKLVSLAISCGLRESGVTNVSSKRVIVAIRCSIRLEVPLGCTGNVMVSKEYLRCLVEIANEKMVANRKRSDRFHEVLLKSELFRGVENGDDGGDCEFVKLDRDLGGEDCLMSNGGAEGVQLTKEVEDDTSNGFLGVPELSLPIKAMVITGEPIDKLHLWGHSACTLETTENCKSVLVFGGFGGIGRHARRRDVWILDPVSGQLQLADFANSPSPRLGHTASLVGELMFVIGGRSDPGNVLNDVWVLNTTNKEWNQLQCSGVDFPQSHRHAAAVIGSNIYVFGGIHNGSISSAMYKLDTCNLTWEEVSVQGEKPSSRHSHTLVAYESQLYMFGGYNGAKALGDLYSFDIQSCTWKKEKMTGSTPYARFSHTMFVYKNYIGIMGGCPIKQHYQELSIFKVGSTVWNRIKLESVGEDLFVRCTTSIVDDDLVIVGGGAAIYAFGTRFSEPMRINLLPLVSLTDKCDETKVLTNTKIEKISNGGLDLNLEDLYSKNLVPLFCVLRVDKRHAKPVKDILKKFGWLDMERKVYTQENGDHICFPITKEFVRLMQNKEPSLNEAVDELNDLNLQENIKAVSSERGFSLLVKLGASMHADDVVKVKKASRSPLHVMKEAIASLLNRRNLPLTLLEQLPTKWERLGDVVVLPMTSFKDLVWDSLGKELWLIVAESLGATRLARQGRILPNGTRDSGLEMLIGDNGWVDHRENGVLYSFDATKCMFSWGNLSEKRRMGQLDCKEEVIVDLFSGIGYFTLPFLVKANAKMLYACEWNPHAIEALRRNLEANGVADRCVVLEGDNRITAPKGVADRVNLGLLPSSEGSWATAVRALRSKGGMMHVHGNVKDSEEESWTEQVSKSFKDISRSEGYNWDVTVERVERVKWYAPHIRHLVVDIRCKQIES